MAQCIINIPNKFTQSKDFKQTLEFGQSIGDISAVNLSGSTIVFDSFSSETEVKARNKVVNSVSKCNDAARHFMTDFNVKFSGKVAAVLSPSMVASYRVVGPRGQGDVLMPADKRPPHVKEAEQRKRIRDDENEQEDRKRHAVAQRTYPETDEPEIQSLQQRIERQKQRLSMLLDDTIPLSVLRSEFSKVPSHHDIPICARPPMPLAPMQSQRFSSLAEAVAALAKDGMAPRMEAQKIAPGSFASALLAQRPFDFSPGSSSETLVCMTPTRDLLRLPLESPHGSSDEVTVSALQDFRN